MEGFIVISLLLYPALIIFAFINIASGHFHDSLGSIEPDLVKRATHFPYKTYVSSPATNPILKIAKSGETLAPGLLFFAPEVKKNPAPLIMSDDGELVWYGGNLGTVNFQVQEINGTSYLSVYKGILLTLGFGYGQITILDSTYSVKYTVCPHLGLYVPKFNETPSTPLCQADLHESSITSDGTLMITAYNVTQGDLTSVGGPVNGWITDSQFYELDISTGNVLFKWSSYEHVSVNKCVLPLGSAGVNDTHPFDFFHMNSVQKVSGGRYLVSSRQTSALYLIDSDGTILWTFNGYNGGDFGPLPATSDNSAHFGFQHHARMEDMSANQFTVSFFNNNNSGFGVAYPSSGMRYILNTATNTSTLLNRYHDPSDPFASTSQGDYMSLPNGNVLLGYGNFPIIKEYGPNNDTDVRMTVDFGLSTTGNYRAYRQEWHAVPAAPLRVVAHPKISKGYVSWNGATDVTSYVIYSGLKRDHLVRKMQVIRTGFETVFNLPRGNQTGYIRVDAYNGTTLLRKSSIIHIKG